MAIIISAPDLDNFSKTVFSHISSQIGKPNFTPLITTQSSNGRCLNILCSSNTPVFGNSYLSLIEIILPFSITNTEFLILLLSFLGAPTIIADFLSFVLSASLFISFSTKFKKSSLKTKSSIG